VNFARLSKLAQGKVVSFGMTKQASFNPLKFSIKPSIPGEFNVLNSLAAVAVCTELGVSSKIIKEVLANLKPLSGRMESVENDLGVKIIIDFAHTPNGLISALKALKKSTGKLIAVIGAEGFRDSGKRSMMGEAAMELADSVIVTSVDPRGLLKEINTMIKEGAMQAGAKMDENYFEIDDRKKAIEFAIKKLAKKGDTVGIFGKGHETSMNLDGKTEISWSDREAVEWTLNSN
jgi:UDP-N-acetylmuramoyl-L-alanyl-D-glutamate--2,6-diaminopimelate ligase